MPDSAILATDTACDAGCPVRRAAEILDGKWTTRIIRDLLGGKRRFSDLLRSLGGISPRILSARLKMLEDHGLVRRTVYPVVPLHTDYELTDLGREAQAVILAMAAFGARLDAPPPQG